MLETSISVPLFRNTANSHNYHLTVPGHKQFAIRVHAKQCFIAPLSCSCVSLWFDSSSETRNKSSGAHIRSENGKGRNMGKERARITLILLQLSLITTIDTYICRYKKYRKTMPKRKEFKKRNKRCEIRSEIDTGKR